MKAQGMTIGAREVIKKCVIKLSDSISMEAKNLGLGYTALSRVCEFFDFALHKRIPWERLEYINHHIQMKSRKDEERRLKHLEQQTMSNLEITQQDYINLLREIDNYCSDGVYDSFCTDVSEKCTCVYKIGCVEPTVKCAYDKAQDRGGSLNRRWDI